ncbi:hypothetical protein ACH4U6_16960 [Streptomyces netropsis]|uniref:hypothetical protein n=1 Tax=Streptomyces netropsis TaxID=55404 RepID=UPI00379C693B
MRRTVVWWLAVAGDVWVRRASSVVLAGVATAWSTRARVVPTSEARAPSDPAGAVAAQTDR